jgi:hypothetical protein
MKKISEGEAVQHPDMNKRWVVLMMPHYADPQMMSNVGGTYAFVPTIEDKRRNDWYVKEDV